MVLLDGLDEAPTESDRQSISSLVKKAAGAFSGCRFVLGSRPVAYRGDVPLAGFAQVQIDALEDEAIETFLTRWCQAQFAGSPSQVAPHLNELLTAVRTRPDIRRLARNPVMLTALAVVHWNERRLPEQRADLYESIIHWLARARERRPGRPSPDHCVLLHQELALAMQDHAEGRQVQIPRFDAAVAIAEAWPEADLAKAEAFLIDEELDSGIVVGRGDHVRFWHLTFQEYLAARALAADDARREDLFKQAELYRPEWRETVLLLAGVLYHQGPRRVNGMFSAVLNQLEHKSSLADRARCYGLLGAAKQDLSPVGYQPDDERYGRMADDVLALFDRKRAGSVDIRVAIEAADALGQVGDPRIDFARKDYWVTIPAGEFLMGAQSKNPQEPNYDKEAEDRESPVHTVSLDSFTIARYPVTVGQYSGCWGSIAEFCRAACRDWFEPGLRIDSLGFRVAAVPPGKSSKPSE